MKISQSETLFGYNAKKQKKIWLSHTAIELAQRCKRCFYLQYKYKIRQPEGIQSRLANRFDTVLKSYFNMYRKTNDLPPLVSHVLSGRLQNPFKETYYYSLTDTYGFYGKLDECIMVNNDHIPVDFKTASSDPREKEILLAYQHQIDEYVYLLKKNAKQTAGYGYLIFFFPEITLDIHSGFPMTTHIVKIKANTDEVEKRIYNAIAILEGDIPDFSPDCSFCNWFVKVKDYYI